MLGTSDHGNIHGENSNIFFQNGEKKHIVKNRAVFLKKNIVQLGN